MWCRKMFAATNRHKFLIALFFAALSTHSMAGDNVKLALKGHIKTKCGISDIENEIDLSKVNTKTVNFGFYCNSPFDISVSSVNGGLKNGRYIARYSVALNIPKVGLSLTGDSDYIKNNKSVKVIDKIPFKSNGEITITLIDKPIMAGVYKETLQINLYPKLVF